MENPTNKVNSDNSKPKANKVNYTSYRKNYSKAKSMLVKKHRGEFKEILASLNGKK